MPTWGVYPGLGPRTDGGGVALGMEGVWAVEAGIAAAAMEETRKERRVGSGAVEGTGHPWDWGISPGPEMRAVYDGQLGNGRADAPDAEATSGISAR